MLAAMMALGVIPMVIAVRVMAVAAFMLVIVACHCR